MTDNHNITRVDFGNLSAVSAEDLHAIATVLERTAGDLRREWIAIRHGNSPLLFDASRVLSLSAEVARERAQELAEAAAMNSGNVVMFPSPPSA